MLSPQQLALSLVLSLVLIVSAAGCGSDGDPHVGKVAQGQVCGGLAGLQCQAGLTCIDDATDACDPQNGGADCGGICQPTKPDPEPQFCGGIAGIACPAGYTCVDDPNDDCDPQNGGADCGGICELTKPDPKPQFCGGLAGIACPAGYTCVDDPSDDCDPNKGGADCGGICQVEVGKGVTVTTDKTAYLVGESAAATVINQSSDSIFLSGCTQVSRDLLENGAWVDKGRLTACVWEGYAVEVKAGARFTEASDVRFSSAGTWRVSLHYGLGCSTAQPLSQAACASFETVYSAPVTVR